MSTKTNPAAMMARIQAAPKTHRKPPPEPVITDCKHVQAGAVWCDNCARTYLNQSRSLYRRAMTQSKHPLVHQAAKDRLTEAITEYSLTKAGLEAMDKEYIQLAAKGQRVEAEKLRQRMKTLQSQAAKRNMEARRQQTNKAARLNTQQSLPQKYILPELNSNNQPNLKDCGFKLTVHAVERMLLREIGHEEVNAAYTKNSAIKPKGEGNWVIQGANGVMLCGFFERYMGVTKFVIATLYRRGTNDPEETA